MKNLKTTQRTSKYCSINFKYVVISTFVSNTIPIHDNYIYLYLNVTFEDYTAE